MKTMNCSTLYLIGLFALVSVCLAGAKLLAIGPDVQVSTFTEVLTKQSSPGLPEDWSVKVWRGTPEIELVKECKGMVLKLRSHQSNVALYKEVHVDLAQHPNLSWEWKVTGLPRAISYSSLLFCERDF